MESTIAQSSPVEFRFPVAPMATSTTMKLQIHSAAMVSVAKRKVKKALLKVKVYSGSWLGWRHLDWRVYWKIRTVFEKRSLSGRWLIYWRRVITGKCSFSSVIHVFIDCANLLRAKHDIRHWDYQSKLASLKPLYLLRSIALFLTTRFFTLFIMTNETLLYIILIIFFIFSQQLVTLTPAVPPVLFLPNLLRKDILIFPTQTNYK